MSASVGFGDIFMLNTTFAAQFYFFNYYFFDDRK